MARHLGDVSWAEFRGGYDALVRWLQQADVAGSIAHDYSLYRALEDCWHAARAARAGRHDDPPEAA